MCKEGIKIGRKADVVSSRVTLADATTQQLLAGDGNRIGVAVAALVDASWGTGKSVVVGPLVNGLIAPVVTLSEAMPHAFLPIERYGSVVTGPIYALGNVGSAELIGVTAVRFVHNLDEL